MIIRYTADVDSVVVESSKTEFRCLGFDVKLDFQEGVLRSVSIERELTEEEQSDFVSRIETREDEPHTLEIKGAETAHSQAKQVLQTLESFFGLHGVDRVFWDDAEVEYIPQSKEEEEQIDVLSAKVSRTERRRAHNWEFDFSNFDWEQIRELSVTLSFFRRGARFLYRGEFVSSYINHYYVIEGLYSGGQHTNVEKQYLSSDELMRHASKWFPMWYDQNQEEIDPFFERYGKETTPEGFIRLLVAFRHQLHHYFHEHDTPHDPSPFDIDEIRPMSYLIKYFTQMLLTVKINEVELSE